VTNVRWTRRDVGGNAGDGQADDVIVEGTAGDDTITVANNANVNVTGLVPAVKILHPEFGNDCLDINTVAGTDTVDHSGLAPGVIQLIVDGVPQ